jgi:hypothetical protein
MENHVGGGSFPGTVHLNERFKLRRWVYGDLPKKRCLIALKPPISLQGEGWDGNEVRWI